MPSTFSLVPTWRAHPECLARLGFGTPGDVARVNAAAVDFLTAPRDEAGSAESVAIAGVIGPRRDGYDPAATPKLGSAPIETPGGRGRIPAVTAAPHR